MCIPQDDFRGALTLLHTGKRAKIVGTTANQYTGFLVQIAREMLIREQFSDHNSGLEVLKTSATFTVEDCARLENFRSVSSLGRLNS